MKKILRKIYEVLTYIFLGVIGGFVIAFELMKGSIHNQSFTFKKTKVKGQDNELDVTTTTTQTQSERKSHKKHKKRIKRQ